MIMLTFASTSTSDLFSMPSSQFEYIKPSYDKKMFNFSSSSDDAMTSSSDFAADDSGFFDDSDESSHTISSIGHDIGTKLAVMCDAFDAEMMSYSRRRDTSRSLLSRVLDFFAF
ncbi:hypothetical protein B9Z55_020551 [Caenorhabditis nigoni]|uniref:Uncharacterized protein n=1 Tax=Caenorhabditis nigoni TaxID=1611254 RepID=A0A2G5TNC3_9PELO|nr:hypothetical protein B9Z55_020551 [Caenorhabditis nigoni]